MNVSSFFVSPLIIFYFVILNKYSDSFANKKIAAVQLYTIFHGFSLVQEIIKRKK